MANETINNLISILTTDIQNAYTALESKEVTIPSEKNLVNLSTTISNIELGIPQPTGAIRNKLLDGFLRERKMFWNENSLVNGKTVGDHFVYTMLSGATEGYIYPIWTKTVVNLVSGHVYMLGLQYRNNINYPDLTVGIKIKASSSSESTFSKYYEFPAASTENFTVAATMFQATEDVGTITGFFSLDISEGVTFDVKRVILVDLTETFGAGQNYSRFFAGMIPFIQEKKYPPQVRINAPTGTYATSTYYTSYGGNFLEYGKVVLVMVGGTSTSYENIHFAAGTLPEGVTIQNQSHYTYTSNAAGDTFCCIIDGIYEDCLIDINMSAINSSSDYVTATISVTFAEE